MAVEWTGLGPDLLLRLDRDAAEPLRAQLEREIREAIRSGRLTPGERLPSSRNLSSHLGISRGLVSECYAQLQAEGYLASRGGSATRVADCAPASPAASAARVRKALTWAPAPGPKPAIDFRPGIPDLSGFPREDWSWALRKAVREIPTEALRYVDPTGSPELQAVLASYLRRVRRAAAEPEQVVVCTGFAQGLNLVVAALVRSGIDTVAVEDPGDPDHRSMALRAGATVVPVPVDEDGIDTTALGRTNARAVVLTPAHQAPTGGVLGPRRRQELVTWANEREAMIVEDDYDAEFRYDREPVGALQGLLPDRVALLGSTSKSLVPALRIGWVVSPPSLLEAVAEQKLLTDRGSPLIEQYAFAALIESGRYDRHLRAARVRYAARRATLVAALERHAPGVPLRGLAAGFHAVVPLPPGASEEAVVAAARDRGVGLYGIQWYSRDTSLPPALVLGFGNLSESAIERGIATVANLLVGTDAGNTPEMR